MVPAPMSHPRPPVPYRNPDGSPTGAAVGAALGAIAGAMITGAAFVVAVRIWLKDATPEEIQQRQALLMKAKWPAAVASLGVSVGAGVGAAMGAPAGRKGASAAAAALTYGAATGIGHATGYPTAGAVSGLAVSTAGAYMAADRK